MMASEKSGGAGKTTLAANRGCYRIECNERTIIAGLDG
jgi:MinD-like ATPase involved in chromosome partitioning or flagellar assembly